MDEQNSFSVFKEMAQFILSKTKASHRSQITHPPLLASRNYIDDIL